MLKKATMGLLLVFFSLLVLNGQERRNVIIFLSDDQGYCELGSFLDFANPKTLQLNDASKLEDLLDNPEGEAVVQACFDAVRKATPNLDRIAEKGVRFPNFFAAPTCGPSRTALMTSRYPQTFGVYANLELSHGVPSEIYFPVKAFAEAGYKTGIVGKWHLGAKEGQHPNDRGFEYYFGYDRAHTDKYNSPHLYRNKDKAEAEGWLCDQITGEALEFLDRTDSENRPFFLFVAFCEPKPPLGYPPKAYMDHINSGSKVLDAHFGSIYGMDYGVGRILEKIGQMGIDQNTMIVFASDNGLNRGIYLEDPDYREHPEYQRVPIPGNGPLRGCKWTPWDGGVRTPMFVWIPGGKSGESKNLVSIMDFMPTALEYAGIDATLEADLDGRSFLREINAKSSTREVERTLFWASMDGMPLGGTGLEGFDRLQMEFNSIKPRKQKDYFCSWYARNDKWKLVGWNGERPYLFDISTDPGERNDLAPKHPEVVKKLRAEFLDWMEGNTKPLVSKEETWIRLFN